MATCDWCGIYFESGYSDNQYGGDFCSTKCLNERRASIQQKESLERERDLASIRDEEEREEREERERVNKAKKSERIAKLFINAAKSGDLDEVKAILRMGEIDIDVEYESTTAYVEAIYAGQKEVADYLKNRGAEIDRCTPLIWASDSNHIEYVKLLLEYGADVNVKDETEGMTPLHWASLRSNPEILKLLLEHGADVNAKDKDGQTALLRAYDCEIPETSLVKLLIEHGADVNAKYDNGQTALHYASLQNNPESVKLYIEHGADVNAKDKNGDTVLHFASESSHEGQESVKLLIEHGADVNIKNNKGKTALHVAIEKNNTEIIELLSKYNKK